MALGLHEVAAKPLCHAAKNADDHGRIGFLVVLEVPQTAIHALFGIFPHRAGVHQDNIGISKIAGMAKARVGHDAEDNLAVREIHLASVCLKIQFAFFGHFFSFRHPIYGKYANLSNDRNRINIF